MAGSLCGRGAELHLCRRAFMSTGATAGCPCWFCALGGLRVYACQPKQLIIKGCKAAFCKSTSR